MAQPTNTFSTYDAVGNREDLSDNIFNISPTTTPFMSMIGKNKATSTKHEWQTDSLAAADGNNFVIEGDDATTGASSPTTRRYNYCAISDKVARVTGTQDRVDTAGRKKEMAYQMMKKSKELKRDMETILLANNAAVAGNDSTARELAGVEAWIATNVDKASDGSNPTGDGTDARTDGTQRAFNETQLKDVLQQVWDSGGEPDVLMVGAHNKQVASGFSGGSTRFDKGEDKKLVAAIDVYVSDFGDLKIIPNRFMRSRSALVLDSKMWKLSMLRPFTSHELAKTGDSERRQILCEYTLEACNEAASGIIADLKTA